MIILSNKGNALLMIDSCPRVTGSKEPGKTVILSIHIPFGPAKIRKRE
jgi:hypothetical protein